MDLHTKRIIFAVLAVIVFGCFTAACFGCGDGKSGKNASETIETSNPAEQSQTETVGLRMLHPYISGDTGDSVRLVMTDDGSFTLRISSDGDHTAYGTYTLDGSILTLTHTDKTGSNTYVFTVLRNGTLMFDASASKISGGGNIKDKTILN